MIYLSKEVSIMKKTLVILVASMLSIFLLACINTTPIITTTGVTTTETITYNSVQTIELYAINDMHGLAYSNLDTLSKMGKYLHDKNESVPNTIIMASGDILQGSAFSNYYHGRPLIEIMNYIGFDAFTIGNHEFDWGIDVIAAYNDNSAANGEADYPFLAANIINKTTDEMMDWTQPYTIVETSGVKVGIIGIIGDVINSISASRVADYEFADIVDTIREYTYHLRTIEDCDIVVVSLHDYSYWVNQEIAASTGDYRVDAVFNGHTHETLADVIIRDGADMPYAQVSSYPAALFAKINLIYDTVSDSVIGVSSQYFSEDDLTTTDSHINDQIDYYAEQQAYLDFINEVLATTNRYINRYSEDQELAIWGSSVIRDYLGLDFGMVNNGGFRTNIDIGDISMGDLVVIYPFDNVIKTCEMTGQQIYDLYNIGGDVVFDDGVSASGSQLYKDGVLINRSQVYTVGAVDYIFDKTYYNFLNGNNIQTSDFFMRDLLATDLRATVGIFDPYNGTSFTE
jgi:2',3'-cyclic-nucleotide 2'-phosphodiesterase (5'-nucleotidase family)